MRDYGKVHVSFWTSLNIRSMSEDGRTLAMYLLTCPHGTIAGVFRLPDGYACDDLQWDQSRVSKGFDELFSNGFAYRCETTKWVWILKHYEWNPPENPNQKKAALKVANQVPDNCAWKLDFIRDCGDFIGLSEQEKLNRIETLSKQLNNPSLTSNSNSNSNSIQTPSLRDAPLSCSTKQKSITFQTWLLETKAKGEKAVSDYQPVWDYAKLTGIPEDWIEIAWLRFKERYTGEEKAKKKRYIDWRGVFLRAVKENWLGLWFFSEKTKEFCLTTVGVCADIDTREAA